MAILTKCSYCGGQVSSDAEKCPHCHKSKPEPVLCVICHLPTEYVYEKIFPMYGKEERARDAWQDKGVKGIVHEGCYQRVVNELRCPVCFQHPTIKEEAGWLERSCGRWTGMSDASCSKCGHPLDLTECFNCGVPLVRKNAIVYRKLSSDYNCWIHKSCVRGFHKT